MKVVIRAKAADDLKGVFTWIGRDNARAAVGTVQRLSYVAENPSASDQSALSPQFAPQPAQ